MVPRGCMLPETHQTHASFPPIQEHGSQPSRSSLALGKNLKLAQLTSGTRLLDVASLTPIARPAPQQTFAVQAQCI
eukprot:1147642-Pelagomonas_calceolata.AAC.5